MTDLKYILAILLLIGFIYAITMGNVKIPRQSRYGDEQAMPEDNNAQT